MRVFVTGASGFIGRAVVRELLDSGHQVEGLARSDKSAQSLIAMGAGARIGSIEDLQCLRQGAESANGAVHLAFFHKITQMSLATRFRVLLRGTPGGIISRFMQAAVEADLRAIETIGNAITGSDRAFVTVLPAMALKPGQLGLETDAADPEAVGGGRIPAEEAALSLVLKGVRSSVIRLAPVVHDRSKQGLATMIESVAQKKRGLLYVGEGQNRWSGVHRLDAARLFRLALEKGVGGERYHAVSEEGVQVREIAEAIGGRLNVPVAEGSLEEVTKLFGWLAPFVVNDNPVSSKLTQERLNWHPAQQGLLADIAGMEHGH